MNIDEVLSYAQNVTADNDDESGTVSKKRRIAVSGLQSSSSSNAFSNIDIEKLIEQTEHVNEIDESTLKRLILRFERKILKNQEMRIKHSDCPAKFMDSEVELFDIIKEMHVIATQPALYNILVEQKIVPSLLGLLSHENTDISCAIVALLQEFTDLDDLDEIDEVGFLMDVLIDSQIIVLLVNNMERLDENVKEESEGIYNSLAIVENLTDYKPELGKDTTSLIQWILRKLKTKPLFYPNKLYASEILSILLQSSEENRSIVGNLNGIDILLHVISFYKKIDPSTADEEEFIENLFNCLCSSLFESYRNRELFFKAEGIELMVLILKEKRKKDSNTDVRVSALKLLNHCLSVEKPDELLNQCCDKFVELLGLRFLLPIFLKPTSIIGYKRKKKQSLIDQVEEHSLSIILALLRFCKSENMKRVLNKFFEENMVKTERLVELHIKYWERLKIFDQMIDSENLSDDDENNEQIKEDLFLRRLNEGGLFTLQLIDHIMVLLADQQNLNKTNERGTSQSETITIKERIKKILNIRKTAMPSSISQIDVIKSIVEELAKEKTDKTESTKLLDLASKF